VTIAAFGTLEILTVSFPVAVVFAGLCLCYVLAADATARSASGTRWGLFAFAFLPVAVPAYFLYRTRLPVREEPADSTERRLSSFGIGGVSADIASSMLASPNSVSLAVYGLPMLAVFVPTVFIY
jgi:hypothetical protein